MDSLKLKGTHSFALLVVLLVLSSGWVKSAGWNSSAQTHMLLETLSMAMAFVVGSMSLAMYQTRREIFFLLVGGGFVGVGLLDSYHMLVASQWASEFLPPSLSLPASSWLASRIMLAVLFVYIVYLLQSRKKTKWHTARRIHLTVMLLVLGCFAVFALIPLNEIHFSSSYFSQPEEFVAGVLFLLTALMLYRGGSWKKSSRHFWIFVAIVLNVITQLPYMAISLQSYDGPFMVAHVIKLSSYLFVLVGLYENMLNTYRQAIRETTEKVRLSERQRWRKTVLEQEATYQSIVDSLPQYIYLKDIKGRYLLGNKRFAELMGVEREQLPGMTASKVDCNQLVASYRVDEAQVMASGKPVQHERQHSLYNENLWFESMHVPLFNSEQQVSGVVGIIWDISEKKKRETELLIKDTAIAESINAIAICTIDGEITYTNHSLIALWQRRNSNLSGKNLNDLMPNQKHVLNELRRQLFEHKRWQGEMQVRRDDGSLFFAQLSAALLSDSQGEPYGILISLIDVTEQKRAMDALLRSEETFSKAQEIAHIGSWDWDIEKNTLQWSDEIYRIFGMRPKEFEATYEAFLACVHPEDREAVQHAVSVSVADKNIPYSIEHRVITCDGEERVVHEQGKVYRDSSGTPIRMIGTVLDITERKRVEHELERHKKDLEGLIAERTRELEAVHSELLKNERLAALGQLTATVSHELRNPLGAMKPSLYIIAKKIKDDKKLAKAVERLDRNITRCDNIIDELLDFTRVKDLNAEETTLNSWLKGLLSEHKIPANIEVVEDFQLDDIVVKVDPGRLQRALINVIDNAIQAMQERPAAQHRLTVQTISNKDRYEIRVSDTGSGIPNSILDKIFEPLFSTKGFGVGLGMPTVRQVMEQHGGGVNIQSIEGKGTTVTLWLPQREPKEAGAAA